MGQPLETFQRTRIFLTCKMGMWWEAVIVGGIMVAIHVGGARVHNLRNYGHAGRPISKEYINNQAWSYHHRDRNNSYTTFLQSRKWRRGCNDGNIFYQFGLENIPDLD